MSKDERERARTMADVIDLIPDDEVEDAVENPAEKKTVVLGAELVIGSDETRLITLLGSRDWHAPFPRVCQENIKHTEHVGDALIRFNGDVAWLFERKELGDLVSAMSATDGRWLDQGARMQVYARVTGARIMYIIEGHRKEYSDPKRTFNFMPVSSLRNAIANKMARDLVHVHFTLDMVETAQFLMEMAWSVHSHGFGTSEPPLRGDAFKYIPINKSESMTPENCFRLMLAQVPGVGRTRAVALAQCFSNNALEFFEKLLGYRSTERRAKYLVSLKVKGISHGIATRIVESVSGPKDVAREKYVDKEDEPATSSSSSSSTTITKPTKAPPKIVPKVTKVWKPAVREEGSEPDPEPIDAVAPVSKKRKPAPKQTSTPKKRRLTKKAEPVESALDPDDDFSFPVFE